MNDKHSVIHSVIFDKTKYKWGEIRCMKWLVNHEMIPDKFDITDERIRARLIEPEKLYKVKAEFRTIEIDPQKGIQFVIAYIPTTYNVKYYQNKKNNLVSSI